MLACPEGDLAAAYTLIGDYRPVPDRSERRDRAAFVSGGLPGHLGVGHGQAADPQQLSELRPGDDPVAGHEHEQEVVRSPAHYERLDHVGGRHAAGLGRLGQAPYRAVPDHAVGEAGLLGGGQGGSGHGSVLIMAAGNPARRPAGILGSAAEAAGASAGVAAALRSGRAWTIATMSSG